MRKGTAYLSKKYSEGCPGKKSSQSFRISLMSVAFRSLPSRVSGWASKWTTLILCFFPLMFRRTVLFSSLLSGMEIIKVSHLFSFRSSTDKRTSFVSVEPSESEGVMLSSEIEGSKGFPKESVEGDIFA